MAPPRRRYRYSVAPSLASKSCSILTPRELLLLRKRSSYYLVEIIKMTPKWMSFLWWLLPGSNWGHTELQSVALPTELKSRPENHCTTRKLIDKLI